MPETRENIKKSHCDKDYSERRALRARLGEMIWNNLCNLGFWDENPNPEARNKHINGLSNAEIIELHTVVTRLTKSLQEIVEKGKGRGRSKFGEEPRGFALWIPDLGARLGTLACNKFGSDLCEQAEFTIEKGEKILKALEPRFRHAEEAE